MSPAERFAAKEGFAGEADRRKRLGQFFTGTGLGRVLAVLADAAKATSIVDPMSGNGDLLAACLEVGAKPEALGAVEIDPVAHEACGTRIPESSCILGSAFAPSTLDLLPRREWDLVIANPPYVRYQSMAKGAGKDFKLPGAVEVRNGLMSSIENMTALDAKDKEFFRTLASGYSGLADLAVPSWILCASMVRVGGRLALVVPESWLSREYAAAVHYLLLRWFVVEHVVEDEHAVWFEDAQVKTTLLIAKRVKRRDSAFSWGDEFFARSRVSGKASGPAGPIARLYPFATNPEASFAKDANGVVSTGRAFRTELCQILPSPISDMARALETTASKQKWFQEVGETTSGISAGCSLPMALAEWAGAGHKDRFTTLESLCISVGQGLRTGANGFFYAECVSSEAGTCDLAFRDALGGLKAKAPSDCVKPVVRRQSELPDGFLVRSTSLSGRVLDLRRVALPEDIKAGGELAESSYAPMEESLAKIVRGAVKADFGKDGKFRSITELSAVAPNIRRADQGKGVAARFWYMLPDFAPRHTPDILVPRINGGSPRALMLAEKGVVADANFSTLNVGEASPDAHAILAMLNSAWCLAVLENSASVMGGGALKIEAAHLRRLPIPKCTPKQWLRLSKLGKRLAETGKALEEINHLVASAALGRTPEKDEMASLSALVEEGRERREKHKNKKEKE